MWKFSVWAPNPASVEVHVAGHNYAMTRSDDDWWSATIEGVDAGSDYGFVVDGSGPYPDPRSRWQPHGVHGLSRTFDHADFSWTDERWQPPPLSSAIIYELHVGTFTGEGTFESAIEKLDYLVELGVTHIELMPVNEFSGEWGWGYDGVDLYAPHHAYGGPTGLKTLIDACHARGLGVILDVVYNHFGPTGNYLSIYGSYFTDHHSTPWGSAVNLDSAGSLEPRRFFIDNALMWLRDYHFDGLRLDAVHALMDQSAIHFLEQLSRSVSDLAEQLGRYKFLVAESDLNDPRIVRPPESGGYGLDAQWSDDFHHAIHAALTGEVAGYYEDFGGTEAMAKALRDSFVYDGVESKHRGRVHGRPARDVPSHRFLGYSQTHDQVGNRARGERLCHLTNFARAKMAAALVVASPFIPMLFQGEEWAASSPFQYFTHHEEEQLARAVSEGRRREFASFVWRPEQVPDPQDPATFERSKLNWAEIGASPHEEMLRWYLDLIRLRRSQPALAAARSVDFEASGANEMLYMRRGNVRLFGNLSGKDVTVAVSNSRVLLASDARCRFQGEELAIPTDATVIISEIVPERSAERSAA